MTKRPTGFSLTSYQGEAENVREKVMPKIWTPGQGERLRAARRPTGFSQEKVAELVGCSWMTVHRWEMDKRGVDETRFAKVAEVYGVDLDKLIYR